MAKKLFYKIGEACKKVDVQPYVLRYWETEFDLLSPDKSKSGQRVYTDDDLAIIRRIKELLYDEGFTTVGAKKKLKAEIDEGRLGSSASDGSKPASSKTGKAKSGKSKSAKSESGKAESKKPVEPEKGEAKTEPAESELAKEDDSASEDRARVAQLESGLRAALVQARGILDRLDAGS